MKFGVTAPQATCLSNNWRGQRNVERSRSSLKKGFENCIERPWESKAQSDSNERLSRIATTSLRATAQGDERQASGVRRRCLSVATTRLLIEGPESRVAMSSSHSRSPQRCFHADCKDTCTRRTRLTNVSSSLAFLYRYSASAYRLCIRDLAYCHSSR